MAISRAVARRRARLQKSNMALGSADKLAEINRSMESMSRSTFHARKLRLERMNKESSVETERDYSFTPEVSVYVKLPLGIINMECELVDRDNLLNQLKKMKSVNVVGVSVDLWWGIVEANSPKQYNWKGYKQLFKIVRDAGFKIQVSMSFHESCEGDIPLPKWIKEIGEENLDIYFTDKDGRRNTESLTWGIDEECVLRGRTAVEVYHDFMKSFRGEFDEFYKDKSISDTEIGLGARGEFRYPSDPTRHGWVYPGIGEFQCYDIYLRKRLKEAAEARGEPSWGAPPENAGSYNSKPQDTKFFCDGGDYDSAYGKFFLDWYSRYLIHHGGRVVAKATSVFGARGNVSVKVSGAHWFDDSASLAAELTSGFFCGYDPIISMFQKKCCCLNFTCVEPDALVDPKGFVMKVLSGAWDKGVPISSENAFSCYDREGYKKILELAKPRKIPYGRHLCAFTYVGLTQEFFEKENLREFQRFVNGMHGESDVEDEDEDEDDDDDDDEDEVEVKDEVEVEDMDKDEDMDEDEDLDSN